MVLLVYAVELGSFTLSVDEEVYAYEPDPWLPWGIGSGRWALALLGYVAPPFATTPFVPTAVFCVGLAFGALLLASCYARSKPEAFAFIGFFVSCPIWLHMAETNAVSWAVGAGVCLTAWAVALLHFGDYRASIPAGVAAGLAAGVYQALLPLFVCGSLLSVALHLGDAYGSQPPTLKDIMRRLAPPIVSSLIAVGLYAGVTQLVLIFFNRKLTYVTQFVRLADFASPQSLQAATSQTIRQLGGLLTGFDPTFIRWRWGITSLAPAWLGAIGASLRALGHGRKHLRTTCAATGLLVGAASCAVAPVIVASGMAPTRALMGLPVVYAVGAAAMMRNKCFEGRLYWLVLSFALFVNVWIAATLFNAEAIARDRDRAMATQLAERLAALPGFQPSRPRALILYGKWAHESAGPALRVEWFGTSFFERDGGNPWRVERYLRLLGIDGLRAAYISCAREDLSELDGLPSWPSPGSVALVRDKVVIKLGPLSDEQRDALVHAPCNFTAVQISQDPTRE